MPPQLRLAKHKRQTPSHTRARYQERQTAARLGAALVPRSGAGMIKGDVRIKKVLRLECKATRNKSFAITREMVRKIDEAALGSGELPAIEIEFLDDKGKVEFKVAVVPSYVLELIGVAR